MEINNIKAWEINNEELDLAKYCIGKGQEYGADAVRITLSKSTQDLFALLNGELERVTHSVDRSISFGIFAAKRYGTFSTNRLEKSHLEGFLKKAVKTVLMLQEDENRKLASVERTEKNAITGYECGLFDSEYETMSPERRIEIARQSSVYGKYGKTDDYNFISEEIEYSDSYYETLTLDSNGLNCRHIETSFEVVCEVTIEDKEGNKTTGQWWDASPKLSGLTKESCGEKALAKAVANLFPKEFPSGKYRMIVDAEVASRVAMPLINALNGYSIQQQNSFLNESLGKQIFHKGLNIIDKPRVEGLSGAKLYDSEGVSTSNHAIIENGVVKEYFINTYMSGKMNMSPTTEDAYRPCFLPYSDEDKIPQNYDTEALMRQCDSGILVTGFNGGNSNSATGDFSYGVEGFVFENGSIKYPVKGMVITGNFITLWNNLIAVGNNARLAMSRQIPSLAFKDVDFSA